MAIYPTFPGRKRKAFTMSYDDGWPQDRRLIELMNKYGIKGTFNLNSGEKLFTELTDAKELYKGHEIAVHALTHAYLDRIAPQTATYEIIKDRENLETYFGGSIRGFAYPYSAYNNDTAALLANCGIKYARTINETEKFNMPSDWMFLNPTCRHQNPKLMELCDTFLNTEPAFNQSKLFYVYGHSYEFDVLDQWGMIEEFFKKLRGRDDIWYATTIEIFDYINAFKNLIMSVDSKYIYNPTATTISLIYSDGDFINSSIELEIKPGEEITL